ncbi:MAG: DNA topoisomerase IV subunit A [Alphaproteobacteria bacterium CG11_big_fil_rev_8_21_14_0_20_44_7]|nr:MAG: DNA topoisomerase IV subunit A [Alphaproteobacteria bacterium CG11_big_fil_rev_8_21_14_0_20_44_7]
MTNSDAYTGDISFSAALSERYLAYSLSTIMSRSLPDVRDGLKPVHRRLLYAMHQLKLNPENGFKKCARVVGDVIGKYHPHGDTAVYDAMVRLAQDFAVRYPLVEGQGNFGSIDGDNPAAMRYTEARLTAIALELLRDINRDTVDFRPTYDGEESEPVVMPATFPNLLANGSEGIAVGMATSIPPHNLDELCEAAQALLKKKSTDIEEIMEIVQGPDLPTGGSLLENKQAILEAYKSGRGSFRIRAKWEKEEHERGQYQIVITEIPYQVQKDKLIEKMAEVFSAKKLPLIGNFRDESDENIRIVIEPKSRAVDAEMLMESVFKLTEFEKRISLNLNVIDINGVPRVLNIKEALEQFLQHRDNVIMRRSQHRLAEIARRLEILDGLLIAYLNIDEVIRIIREEDEPKAVMIKKWALTDLQAESILNLRLRNLRKLEEFEIRKEHEELLAEQAELQSLIEDESKRKKMIRAELQDIRERFGSGTKLGARRTIIKEPGEAVVVDIEAFIESEPITVLLSDKGWIRALKGYKDDVSDTKYKEGDAERFALKCRTTDKLLIFTTSGKFYTIGGDKIQTGKGFGAPISLLVDMEQDEKILNLLVYKAGEKYLIASTMGKGFIVAGADVLAQTKGGKQVLNVGDKKALTMVKINGDMVAVSGNNRKLLIFPLAELPEMKRGQGVALQKYKDAEIADITCFNLAEGLSWSQGKNRTRTETDLTPWIGKRAQSGRMAPQGFPRDNKF